MLYAARETFTALFTNREAYHESFNNRPIVRIEYLHFNNGSIVIIMDTLIRTFNGKTDEKLLGNRVQK